MNWEGKGGIQDHFAVLFTWSEQERPPKKLFMVYFPLDTFRRTQLETWWKRRLAEDFLPRLSCVAVKASVV